MKLMHLWIIASFAATAFSCSSAPPAKEEEVIQKNQAVQFAESGNKYYNDGLYDQALGFFRLSLFYNGAVFNERGIVESHNSIGKTYIALGSYDLAAQSFALAIELARNTADKELVATCLNNQAELALARKQNDQALSLLTEAVSTGSGIKQQKLAVIHHNLGLVYKRLGRLDQAIASFKTALGMNLQNKGYVEAASNYYMLSSVFSEKADYVQAIENAQKALELDKKFENSLGIAKDCYALGILSARSGKDADAYRYYRNGLFVYDSLIAIRPTLSFKEEKKDLLQALVQTAQKLKDDKNAAEYAALLKELLK